MASRFAAPNQPAAPARKNSLTAHLRVRGEDPPSEIIVKCKELEEAIQCAKRKFKHFDSRNPWIFRDSIQGRIYVLVDPEWKTHKRANGATSRRK